jgi:hypothetical protein
MASGQPRVDDQIHARSFQSSSLTPIPRRNRRSFHVSFNCGVLVNVCPLQHLQGSIHFAAVRFTSPQVRQYRARFVTTVTPVATRTTR